MDDWRSLYVEGIDLLNRGEYFEAHEVLEDVWRASVPQWKLYLQALVQVAVSMHHHSKGNLNGARSVLAKCIRNFSQFEEGWQGLDLEDLRRQLVDWQHALDTGEPADPVHIRWKSAKRPSDGYPG
jgi:predicted metal-dependent hydrolase